VSARRSAALAAFVALGLVLGACSSNGKDEASSADRSSLTTDDATASDLASDGTTTTGGGSSCDTSAERRTDVPAITPGNIVGRTVSTKDLIRADEGACLADSSRYLTVDLVGATAGDGKVFADTWKADRPLTLRLGTGQLVPGLDTALDGMAVGARRQVFIPAELAYGSQGDAAQGIGPDADLAFVVDLLSVSAAPRFCSPGQALPKGVIDGKPAAVDTPRVAPTGSKATVEVLEPGDGPKATDASYVTVHYVGVSCWSGRQFDSSWDQGVPITVALPGATPTATAFQVIDGWNQGLVGQAQGSLVRIDIPSDAAYGDAGQLPDIGPADPLTFVVRILKVSDQPPTS
jgi:peptidylprolyl isomerase